MLDPVASRYRIVERLGAGGMGEVYLAEDLRLRRQVALKVLPSSGGDDAARARLFREARMASSLSHPGIAVIYEIDEVAGPDGRTSFIAMEYVRGRTLAQHARARSLSPAEILPLVRQAAEALAAAHDHGVVHRDVKSSNIMVTDDGRVKVLDFGLAKYTPPVADTESTWSRVADGSGLLIGTVAYMSPEQALGRELDPRTDIFSLGVVFHELLTGTLPFPGANPIAVIDAILHRDPPPLALSGEILAPELQRMARRMLARDREDRYQSMRELLRDLDALERGPGRLASAAPLAGNAVAVMTFTNITRDHEDDWLGTGIAETVTADLKRIEGVRVVARERIWEALRKLGGPAPAADEALATRIGRELDARWVVAGGYQRLGEVVRVTARIIDVETGAVTRTVKLDGRMGEIFALQDRIVGELSEGLRLDLGAGRGAGETHVVEAYEAFGRGVLNLRLESYEALDRAVLFFERAVALDPRYARAHLQLGSAYDIKAGYLVMPELHERALGCFRRAIDLAPDLAQAWKEMGSCLISLGREDEGIEAVQRALALDPADAAAHSAFGRAYLVGQARFAEAAAEYETALRLNPQAGWAALQLAHCLALLRDFARGEEVAGRAAALQERMQSGKDGVVIVGAYMRLGHLAALQGRHAQALTFFERELAFMERVDHALRDRSRIELHQRIGASHLRLGHAAEAQAAFEVAVAGFDQRVRLGADEPFTRFYAAAVHALRGEVELALAGLARAAKMRRAFTIERARIEPEFDGLRSDRRFQDLLAGA